MSTLDVIVRDGGNPLREAERRIVLSAVKMDAIDKEVRKIEGGKRGRGGSNPSHFRIITHPNSRRSIRTNLM